MEERENIEEGSNESEKDLDENYDVEGINIANRWNKK